MTDPNDWSEQDAFLTRQHAAATPEPEPPGGVPFSFRPAGLTMTPTPPSNGDVQWSSETLPVLAAPTAASPPPPPATPRPLIPAGYADAVATYGRSVVDCTPEEWNGRSAGANALWLLRKFLVVAAGHEASRQTNLATAPPPSEAVKEAANAAASGVTP